MHAYLSNFVHFKARLMNKCYSLSSNHGKYQNILKITTLKYTFYIRLDNRNLRFGNVNISNHFITKVENICGVSVMRGIVQSRICTPNGYTPECAWGHE